MNLVPQVEAYPYYTTTLQCRIEIRNYQCVKVLNKIPTNKLSSGFLILI
jgi:hypothetical protein